jgi:3-deoxy-D-manno-octulosonate 8-phosphate phosphatase (KDO 8-P phosphatase)
MAAKKLTRAQLVRRFRTIKLLALDVDGVLTNNWLYIGTDGLEIKQFNIADGFYMKLAMRSGLPVAIVSGRHSPATDARMKELGVEYVMQGKADKPSMLTPLLKELGIEFAEVAYMGDELLDLSIGRKVGLPIAVKNAAKEFKEIALYVTKNNGGEGAVREVIECYFEAVDKNPEDFIY